MGIVRKTPAARVAELGERVGSAMRERRIEGRDALAGLSDGELRDLDCVLQVARHALHRQGASSKAVAALEEVVSIAEEAAAEAERTESRAAELLALAEAAVGRIRECQRGAQADA